MPANTGSILTWNGSVRARCRVPRWETAPPSGMRDSAENEQGFLLNETAGIWETAVEAPLPANVGSKPQVRLHPLSCPSAGN